MSLRNCPRTSQVVSHSSATINMRSPGTAPKRSQSAALSVAEMNFATGDSNVLPSATRSHTKPFAPTCFARSVSASSLPLPDAACSGYVAASTRIPLIDAAVEKALNSVAAKISVSSCNSSPKRRSGLSTPNLFIASCQVICSIGGTATPVAASAAAVTALPIAARTSG